MVCFNIALGLTFSYNKRFVFNLSINLFKMVYKYKRKTDRASWSEENLKKAMLEAQISSITASSKKYGIPYATLYRHLQKGSAKKKLGRFETIFTPKEEEDLVAYVKKMDSIFYGLTRVEFLRIVGEFAKKIGKEGVFTDNIAGKGWFHKFRARHPELVLRTPEPTSIARVKGFNRVAVERFYSLLEETIEKHNIIPDMMYNVDETGVTTTSNKPPKVLSISGKKQVGVVSSKERGVLTTIICCCSPTGTFIPPFFIFKRKKFDQRLLDGAQPGSEATITDSGWVNTEKFLSWLHIFVEKVRPTEERKALLLLDNHESHKSYAVLDYASNNNVIFLSIPPHTSHRLQPLDVAVYGPIKKYFEMEVNTFQKAHLGRIINQYDVAKLFTNAYLKGATPANAISGFRASGIYPFNKQAIGEEHFAPSEIYQLAEQPGTETLPENIVQREDVPVSEPPSPLFLNQVEVSKEPVHGNIVMEITEQPNSLSRKNLEPVQVKINKDVEDKDKPRDSASKCIEPNETDDLEVQNNSNISNIDILREIRPIPKEINKRNIKGRKPQRAEVLTSTPIKLEQKKRQDAVSVKKKVQFDDNSKAGSSNVKKKKKKNEDKENTKEYRCTVCQELYIDPPDEDWIRCDTCYKWTHEACSSYLGFGSYFCDDCFD